MYCVTNFKNRNTHNATTITRLLLHYVKYDTVLQNRWVLTCKSVTTSSYFAKVTCNYNYTAESSLMHQLYLHSHLAVTLHPHNPTHFPIFPSSRWPIYHVL
jgi:hypothetical protein